MASCSPVDSPIRWWPWWSSKPPALRASMRLSSQDTLSGPGSRLPLQPPASASDPSWLRPGTNPLPWSAVTSGMGVCFWITPPPGWVYSALKYLAPNQSAHINHRWKRPFGEAVLSQHPFPGFIIVEIIHADLKERYGANVPMLVRLSPGVFHARLAYQRRRPHICLYDLVSHPHRRRHSSCSPRCS